MVNHDDFVGQKPVCESVKACGLCACGSSSVCERETVGEGSSNSCVGMSAGVGSNSLVGMSACIGSDSLAGVSACVGSDSLVGMSACGERPQGSVDLCERLRDQSFCVFGAGKSIEPSSQRCVHARETCCVARAFGTMMRMLLIWLLVFSTFVGVGCDYVGAPPKWLSQADFATSHSWLSQADFATSHSGLSQADFAIAYSGPSLTDYTTSFLAYHGREQFIRRRAAAGISCGCQCHEVVLGLEGGRIGQRGRPNTDPLQTDTIRDTNVRCILGGLLHPERMARDAVKSADGGTPEEEYIPGPPTSITQYAVPITATDPCNRVYIQDQSMQTSDLELAHAQRYRRASEGEAWAYYGWDAERVKNLLQDRNYGLSIDEVNLAHQALSSLAAYEGLKSGEAELYREAHPNMLEWGLLLCFPDRYGPLQQSLGPNEGLVAEAIFGGISKCGWAILDARHGYAAAWDFAFKGEGFRHCWWAFDYDCYCWWALQKPSRAIERNRERERSRSRPKVLPPKHIPARQSMVAINLDAPTPVPGPTPALKADPQLPPQNFVMVVHPMSTDVAAVPPGADADVVMVKAMPPPPTPTPITILDVVVKAMPVAPPGIVVKSTMRPPLRWQQLWHRLQQWHLLVPASSKAEAVSMATGPVDMEDAAIEEASPITPPFIEHPLVELGAGPERRVRGRRALDGPRRHISKVVDVHQYSRRSGRKLQYRKLQRRLQKLQYQKLQYRKLAVSEAAVSEAATAMPAEDAAAVGVSAVSATVDTIRDGIDLRDL